MDAVGEDVWISIPGTTPIHVKVTTSTSTTPAGFLFDRTIDIDTYDRHRDRLSEELTLTQMDRYATELEELDVEGILTFAERVLPSASNLWVQSC